MLFDMIIFVEIKKLFNNIMDYVKNLFVDLLLK